MFFHVENASSVRESVKAEYWLNKYHACEGKMINKLISQRWFVTVESTRTHHVDHNYLSKLVVLAKLGCKQCIHGELAPYETNGIHIPYFSMAQSQLFIMLIWKTWCAHPSADSLGAPHSTLRAKPGSFQMCAPFVATANTAGTQHPMHPMSHTGSSGPALHTPRLLRWSIDVALWTPPLREHLESPLNMPWKQVPTFAGECSCLQCGR